MVLANPPLAEPVTDPGGVINKPPFEMGVANFVIQGQHETKNNLVNSSRYWNDSHVDNMRFI